MVVVSGTERMLKGCVPPSMMVEQPDIRTAAATAQSTEVARQIADRDGFE